METTETLTLKESIEGPADALWATDADTVTAVEPEEVLRREMLDELETHADTEGLKAGEGEGSALLVAEVHPEPKGVRVEAREPVAKTEPEELGVEHRETVIETEAHAVLEEVRHGERLSEVHPEAEGEPLSVPQVEGLTVAEGERVPETDKVRVGETVTETEAHTVLEEVRHAEGLSEVHPEAEGEPLSVLQVEGLTVVE